MSLHESPCGMTLPSRQHCCADASVRARLRRGAPRAVPMMFLASVLLPLAALGQSAGSASPFLPPSHWSHAALEHLQGAGLIEEGFDPAGSTVTRSEAFYRFDAAASTARDRRPEWVGLVESYLDRFSEEFPGTARHVSDRSALALEAALIAGVETHQNGLEPRHYLGELQGFDTRALSDNTQPAGGMEMSLLFPSSETFSFGVHGALQLPADRVFASEAYGLVRVGNVGIWGGRRKIRFGSADAGSVVLSSESPFDGAGVFLANGSRLPGFLAHLGAFRVEAMGARLDQAGQVERPWFLGIRASLAPHPQFRIGVNRAAVFGGNHEIVPSTTFTRIAKTIFALDNNEQGRANFEDQIASVDLWFAPTLGSLPLVMYGEWGFGDLAAQKTEMPALVGGIQVPGFPGAPWFNVGMEVTSFHTSDTMGRPWYEHRVFGTWTDDGNIRGHELGGAGSEFRLMAGADLLDARLRIETRGFTRDRKPGNLFAPEREGSSNGFGWTVRWRLVPSVDLETSGIVESGSGWTQSGAFVGTRLTL